jgi:biotin carboxyl carrier protein
VQYEVEINGRRRRVAIERADRVARVTIDGRPFDVDAARVDAHTLSLIVNGRTYEIAIAPDPASSSLAVTVGAALVRVSLNGRGRWRRTDAGAAATGPERVVAPMSGKIVRVLVQSGEAVHARQPLVVVEAMKMENELKTPKAGKVLEIRVSVGQAVEKGEILAVIE